MSWWWRTTATSPAFCRRSLDKEGYEVRIAGDGETALDQAGDFEPDAVVLDLGLPRLDGVEVCRRLRDEGDVPILILTARDALDARVAGLDSGADDYLVKPFEREELLARLRALLRRRPPRGCAFLVVGDLRLNPDSREVFRGERELELTAREFELLEHLMRNERIVVSRAGAARRGVGLPPLRRDQHRRRVHLQPAPQARGGWRAARAAHRARRGLRAEAERMRTPACRLKLKLAVVSAALTFGILLLFAVVVGAVAEQRIRAGFDDDLRATAADLVNRHPARREHEAEPRRPGRRRRRRRCRGAGARPPTARSSTRSASRRPGPPGEHLATSRDYRVVSRDRSGRATLDGNGTFGPLFDESVGDVLGFVQYAKPRSERRPHRRAACALPRLRRARRHRCSPSSAGCPWPGARCARSPGSRARRARWRARATPT